MGAFLLVSLGLLGAAAALAAWRRRGATPYDDPTKTIEALRDRQRFLYDFGVAPGPNPWHEGERAERK